MKAAFYKGTRPGLGGLFNMLVRFWTKGPYSHVELIFSDGMSASSSFIDGGVRFKLIKYDESRWDFIELPDSLEENARKLFVVHAGKAYDYWANIRFSFGFIPDSKDKYMCAEAGMAALGFDDAWRFEPNIAASSLRRLKNVR